MNINERLFQWDEILEKMRSKFHEDYTIKGALNALALTYGEFSGEGRTSDICAIYDHDNKKVTVKSTLDDVEKYFAIAHEIGHALLHPTQNYVDTFTRRGPKVARETEANIVAYELTMPIAEFIEQYNNTQPEDIANHFFVEVRRVNKRIEFLRRKGIIN